METFKVRKKPQCATYTINKRDKIPKIKTAQDLHEESNKLE